MKYLIKKPDTFLSMLNDDITSVLHKSFDNLFPEYVFEQEVKGMTMPVDIKEFEDKYLVKVELPGIERDNIEVDLHKNSLKISAEKKSEKEENDKKKKYHKSEFRYGNYCRTIYFPVDVNMEKCDAKLKNGILSVELEKLQKEEDKKRKIEISEA
ncbi:MAG: Hsp20/alpha crystallin family protein [Candidatus Gastranaerophilales bacterium]|nr:Hsp20/alpha crystallin family protein [Candidatus Gastranaerophilales bacterium]